MDIELKAKMFQEMMEGYKTNQEGLLSHGARCLADLEEGNPFPEGSEAKNHFHRMKAYYAVCKRGGINQRSSMRKIIDEARALCALDPEQPYKVEKPVEPVKEEPVEEVHEEIKEEKHEVPAETKLFGALEESVNKPKRKPFLKR